MSSPHGIPRRPDPGPCRIGSSSLLEPSCGSSPRGPPLARTPLAAALSRGGGIQVPRGSLHAQRFPQRPASTLRRPRSGGVLTPDALIFSSKERRAGGLSCGSLAPGGRVVRYHSRPSSALPGRRHSRVPGGGRGGCLLPGRGCQRRDGPELATCGLDGGVILSPRPPAGAP